MRRATIFSAVLLTLEAGAATAQGVNLTGCTYASTAPLDDRWWDTSRKAVGISTS